MIHFLSLVLPVLLIGYSLLLVRLVSIENRSRQRSLRTPETILSEGAEAETFDLREAA